MKKIKRNLIGCSLLLVLISSACARKSVKRDVKNNLENAMEIYLNSPKRVDTAKVKFKVLDVIYYEDKLVYDCQFKVHMKNAATDTIGQMGATVTKDFSTVKRKY